MRRLSGRGGPDALSPQRWGRFYEFYSNTVDKRWGSAYLTKRFFEMCAAAAAAGAALHRRCVRPCASNTCSAHTHTPRAALCLCHTRLGSDMPDKVLLVAAEDEGGDMVAGALNLLGSHAIYGRNWGCVADREWKGLHFECCYYQVRGDGAW